MYISILGGSVASASSAGAVGSGAQVDSTALGHPADVLDMPVDPNEPTYCLCHQVSYGEMIGCDNPDVSLYYMFLQIFYNFILIIIHNFLIFFSVVSYRMVPFCLCWINYKT